MLILNKHVKWRKENNKIFICDCKRLIDLKVNLDFEESLKQFERGFKESDLNQKSRILFQDFKKLKLFSDLKIRKIKEKEFYSAMKILDNELKRVRDNAFLLDKFKKYPEFFIGVFVEDKIIGVICGFPREDYLLLSEIAIDSKFQNRGFGKKLIEEFENTAKQKYYKIINAGAQDKALDFYKSLNYKPFLLIQYKKIDYSLKDFKKIKIIRNNEDEKYERLEVKISKPNLKLLNNLRKQYSKANFQYIFTKNLN